MRPLSLLLLALLAAACNRAEPPNQAGFFTLQRGQKALRMGCNVVLDDATSQDVTIRYACRVPSAEQTEERWWGNRAEPTPLAMKVGDCLRLEAYLYCVEEIEPGKSASFRSLYLSFPDSAHILKRLQGE